jgi:hypothetical protein
MIFVHNEAINLETQMSSNRLDTLKMVWNRESAIGTASALVIRFPIPKNILNRSIHPKNIGKIDSTQITPNTLYRK